MSTIKKYRFYTAILLSVFAFSGCIEEISKFPAGNDSEFTVTIDLPGSRTTTTDIGTDYDNNITTIDVLMFDKNNGDRYLGHVFPLLISDVSDATGTKKQFDIKVPNNKEINFVILANARHIVTDPVIASNLEVNNTTKTAVYALLTESLPQIALDWQTWSTTNPIPMWGETITVNTATVTTVSASLLRMLAKINLSLTDVAAEKLQITEVHLCNYHTSGFLAAPATPNPTTTKLTGYDNRLIYAVTGNTIQNEIFLFEVAPPPSPDAPSRPNRLASTCLIVKGHYDGSTDDSYYRIDIRNYPNGSYLGVTRNNVYDIVIQSVTGPGSPTGEIAYDSELININATIRIWQIGYEMEFDYEHYRMVVSESRFHFNSTGTPQQTLRVFSDHPVGWKIEFDDDGSNNWINVSPTTSNNTVNFVDVTINCLPNEALGEKTGRFYITTPGLRKRITVTQDPLDLFAPPGVLGVTAGGRLTLRGSYHYANNEDIKAFADAEFGGLENESVWIVYYKWGSVVAMHSRLTDIALQNDFTSAVIAHTPAGYDRAGLISSIDAITGTTAADREARYNLVPYYTAASNQQTIVDIAAGLGDPCAFATIDAAGTLAGSTWRTPAATAATGRNWNGTAYTHAAGPNQLLFMGVDVGNGIPVAGRMSQRLGERGWFFPLSLFRSPSNVSLNPMGYFWTNTSEGLSFGTFNGRYLNITSFQVIPAASNAASYAFAVRCVSVPANARVTAFVNVMYDFQHQTLTAYDITGTAPTSWQWQVSTSRNGTYTNIPGATNATYVVPVDFIHSSFVNNLPNIGDMVNDELFFKCILTNTTGTVPMTNANALGIEFIRTTNSGQGTGPRPGYGIDANGVRYLEINRGGTLNDGKIKMALLNLGQSGTGAYRNGVRVDTGQSWDDAGNLNNAADLGDFYQWGRIADGHQHTVWSKDATYSNVISPMTGGNNTSSFVQRNFSAQAVNSFGQVTGTGYVGNFITRTDAITSPPESMSNLDWSTEVSGVGTTPPGVGNSDFWGNGEVGGDKTNRVGTPISLNNWTAKGQANNPCPAGWRVPSDFEVWDIYRGNGSNIYVTTYGNAFTSTNANSNDWRFRGVQTNTNTAGGVVITNNVTVGAPTTTGAKLFLPSKGYRMLNNGTFAPFTGEDGLYWSSAFFSSTLSRGFGFGNAAGTLFVVPGSYTTGRANGLTVRCVSE
ncbi:MAG: hypothetical protein LBI15_11795 [Dysgonamonadaceae bacterium]|jgi:hypothetical protein|nr:hypothetical protein [Dysgonamonadaceae bacterium]